MKTEPNFAAQEKEKPDVEQIAKELVERLERRGVNLYSGDKAVIRDAFLAARPAQNSAAAQEASWDENALRSTILEAIDVLNSNLWGPEGSSERDAAIRCRSILRKLVPHDWKTGMDLPLRVPLTASIASQPTDTKQSKSSRAAAGVAAQKGSRSLQFAAAELMNAYAEHGICECDETPCVIENAIKQLSGALDSSTFRERMGIKTEDAKWLDPECWEGCKSLIWKRQRDEAVSALRELNNRVHSGYDFNSDPDQITLLVGKVFESAYATAVPPVKTDLEE